MRLKSTILRHKEEILDFARRFHENPELSLQEYDTTRCIREVLEGHGVEVLDCGLGTGLVGLVRGRTGGETVALRADIDALPVTEDPGQFPLSKREGLMHACGHDTHAAALLGAGIALQSLRETLRGSVLLIFQPAEEVSAGASMVMNTGVLERFPPKALFSVHVMPDIPAGQVGVKSGVIMAAQEVFSITVTGAGGHGAFPHTAHDPVSAAAQIIAALQTIASRRISPVAPFVLSVCSVHGGGSFNVIPDAVELGGTCRYTCNAQRDFIIDNITKTVENTAKAHSCTADIRYLLSLPALENNASLAFQAKQTAAQVFGDDQVIEQELKMGSEDFSLYAQKTPIFMYHVGCAEKEGPVYPLHNRCFQVPRALVCPMAELLARSAIDAL